MRTVCMMWICVMMVARAFGQEAFVTLKYSDENAEEQRYFITPAEDGSFNLAKKFVIAPDLDGYVRLKIKLRKPGIVYTSGLDRPMVINVAPGKNVFVRIENAVTFGGDLRTQNAFANRFVPRDSVTGRSRLQVKLAATATPGAFMDSLKKEIDSDMLEMEIAAEEERRLSKEFKKSLSTSHLLLVLCQAGHELAGKVNEERASGDDDHEWANARGTLFPDSLVNCGLTIASEYSDYLVSYVNYLANTTYDRGWKNDSLGLAKCIWVTDQYLHGSAKETYMSMFFSSNILPGAVYDAQQLVGFYDKFKKEFPNSASIPVLEPEMKRIGKTRPPVKR